MTTFILNPSFIWKPRVIYRLLIAHFYVTILEKLVIVGHGQQLSHLFIVKKKKIPIAMIILHPTFVWNLRLLCMKALIGHFYATILWQLVIVGHGQQLSH